MREFFVIVVGFKLSHYNDFLTMVFEQLHYIFLHDEFPHFNHGDYIYRK